MAQRLVNLIPEDDRHPTQRRLDVMNEAGRKLNILRPTNDNPVSTLKRGVLDELDYNQVDYEIIPRLIEDFRILENMMRDENILHEEMIQRVNNIQTNLEKVLSTERVSEIISSLTETLGISSEEN